jgi:hypothetical protein
MIVAWAPLLIAILGLLIYGYAGKEKAVEVGRLLFFCGVFWLVYKLAGKTIQIP